PGQERERQTVRIRIGAAARGLRVRGEQAHATHPGSAEGSERQNAFRIAKARFGAPKGVSVQRKPDSVQGGGGGLHRTEFRIAPAGEPALSPPRPTRSEGLRTGAFP